MRRICLLFLLLGFGTVPHQTISQTRPGSPVVHNCEVYRGYLTGDMAIWTGAIRSQEQRYRNSGSSDDLYVLVLSRYGYIAYLINMKRDADVRTNIAVAEAEVEKLSADKRYEATASAIRGALLAMRISLNPLKATYLGMRSLRQIEESLRINPADPAGWVEMGNARYHMPAVVGGSYLEAAKCFSEAVTLFEKDRAMLQCNWHYLHALVWLAKSHEGLGNLREARKVYEKALGAEPEFQWVKTELYPQLLKRMEDGG